METNMGMKDKVKLLMAMSIAVYVTVSKGEEPTHSTGIVPVFSGYASFQAGEVYKGEGITMVGNNKTYSHKWMETAFAGLMAEAAISDHLKVLVAMEGELDFSFYINTGSVAQDRPTLFPRTGLNIKHAEGIYSFGNPEGLFFQLEAGLFPYKYNPDVRNLGEYLFRSFPYPQFIMNVFDRPYADVAGLRIGNNIGSSFHQDVLLTSEIHNFPYEDFSLSYVANYNFAKVVEVGAGINFDRLFSVNSQYTTPPDSADGNQYFSPSDNTGFYSYSGIITAARLSIDPKRFLPEGIFGDQDLRLYSEFAILGLKDYPVDTNRSIPYYTNIWERMPVTVGFNFPVCAPLLSKLMGFQLLDLLNSEIEYYDNRFTNSYRISYNLSVPLPDTKGDAVSQKGDNLRWSLYMKRNFGKNFLFIVQIAKDHLIPESFSTIEDKSDRTDVLKNHGDWWWIAKMQFAF